MWLLLALCSALRGDRQHGRVVYAATRTRTRRGVYAAQLLGGDMAAAAPVDAVVVDTDETLCRQLGSHANEATENEATEADTVDVVGYAVEAEAPTTTGPRRSHQCSICLLDVLPEQHASAAHPDSGCLHSFHWACLATHLAVDTSCPNCRRPYHIHGVYEVSPTGERRLHVPQHRRREPRPVDTSQYTMVQRCCMHKLAIPVIGMVSLIVALPICTMVLFLLAPDGS